MNFAKRELMKYGWKEGKGLGKESTGIVAPVRPKLKFDNKGLGFNYGEEYSFKWWVHVYNNTAAKISVNSAEDGTKSLISTKSKKPTQISTKKRKSSKKLNDKKKYNNFVKEEPLDDLRINCRKRDNCQKMNGISSEKLDPSLTSDRDIFRGSLLHFMVIDRFRAFAHHQDALIEHSDNIDLPRQDYVITVFYQSILMMGERPKPVDDHKMKQATTENISDDFQLCGPNHNNKIMRHGKFSGKLARLLSQENQFLLNKEKVTTICV